MEKFGRKLLTLCVTAAMLTGLLVPAAAAYVPYASQISTPFVTTNEHGREIHFADIDGGSINNRTDTGDELTFYKKAITSNNFLQDWASIAYNIFESQPKSYWDHAGNGWDADFGNGHYIDLVYDFQNSRYTKDSYFGVKATGLSVANSLKEVQNRAANDLAALVGRKMTGNNFMSHHAIDGLSDSQRTVLYTTVSTVDRYGGTPQYGYNSFSLVFYDFQLHVLSDDKQLSGEVSTNTTSTEDGLIVMMENNDLTDLTSTATLARSVSSSVSSTISNSESYSFGQTYGASASFTEKVPDIEESSFSLSAEFSYGQVMETAYSQEKTLSETVDTSLSVQKTLPPHTKECSQQTLATTTLKTTFDCPVGLTYKVAIFSMCGTMYDDNALVQAWNTAGYEQRSFVTFFGAGTDTNDAVESLYQRGTYRPNDPSYDQTYGLTKGTNDENKVWCSSLNWSSIAGMAAPTSRSASGLKGGTDLIYALDDAYPMSLTGGTTSLTETSIYTEQGTTYPMLPISSVYIPWQMGESVELDRTFQLTVGETHPISSYRVEACDRDAVPYFGFVSTSGTWKIVDTTGREASSDVAVMEYDPVTGVQILKATAPGTAYVKYFIPENYYYTWDGVASTNANISSAAYKIVVSAPPEVEPEPFEGTLQLTGSVSTIVGETINLNGEGSLSVAAYDTTDKKVKAAVSWEARELEEDGISVSPDGVLTTTKAGTFHVRAYMDAVYSDWVEVIAEEFVEPVVSIRNYPFIDVDHNAWYDPAVEFVFLNRVMAGVKTNAFYPEKEVTRAQVAQILYNLEGKPQVRMENPFADVADNAWYAKAVTWAAASGLTTGKSADRFDPNASVTREQLVTFVCRYADWAGLELPDGTATLSQYQDADQISDWAKDFIVRALEAGIIQGKSADTLAPQGTATRAEIAQIFMNLLAE
ncbi:MAG: S-layer homology domain-containing protein [Ruminiclostridium sp.]|nr:S-layer homology domain-containing protein [Ruminiclostridium sp.]